MGFCLVFIQSCRSFKAVNNEMECDICVTSVRSLVYSVALIMLFFLDVDIVECLSVSAF